jgi:hypothetical protein
MLRGVEACSAVPNRISLVSGDVQCQSVPLDRPYHYHWMLPGRTYLLCLFAAAFALATKDGEDDAGTSASSRVIRVAAVVPCRSILDNGCIPVSVSIGRLRFIWDLKLKI